MQEYTVRYVDQFGKDHTFEFNRATDYPTYHVGQLLPVLHRARRPSRATVIEPRGSTTRS